jgi:hypothetical protein
MHTVSMLITGAQMDTFRQALEAAFEDRMVSHFREELPDLSARAGEAGLRSAIRLGRERARGYGLGGEPSICSFITVMFLLGSGFDDDPLLPWASSILRGAAREPEDMTVTRLREVTLAYLDEAEGDDGELLEEALARLRDEPLDLLLPPFHGDGAAAYLVSCLSRLYPARCSLAGEDGLSAMVDQALEAAKASGLESAQGAGLYAILMLMLGAHFERDPLLPWAQEAIERVRAAPARDREAELRRALSRWAGGEA